MRTTLHRQLSEAFEKTKWSVQELLDKSGLDLDRSSLDRKLKGELPLKTSEAEAIADALGVTITYRPTKNAKNAA